MNKLPETIEELKQIYIERNLPPEEVTRFFIGKNIQEPKAFGIYKDGEDFIVYKNKADGTRAVRYKGPDESFAVSQLYTRLDEEIYNQTHKHSKSRNPASYTATKSFSGIFAFVIVFIFIAIVFGVAAFSPREGYYSYGGNYYYCQNYSWYVFDRDNFLWEKALNIDSEFKKNRSKYYVSYNYIDSSEVSNFRYSRYYEEPSSSSSSSSWDSSSSSWDSGSSWDSSSTDWSSDW